MAEVIILGTGSMVPTKERNVQAFYLDFDGEGMLFDCGEGTQRQMNIAGISRAKVHKIFITHWHGDHVAGLIGLIQTMGNSQVEHTLHIYGPKGTKEHMFHMMNATIFENKLDIEVHELLVPPEEEYFFLDTERYKVSAMRLDHSVPSIGYAWYEKDRVRVDMATCKKLGIPEGPLVGKLSRGQSVVHNGQAIKPEDVTYKVAGRKIAIMGDTGWCQNLVTICRYADLMICEASFNSSHEDKAIEFKHMTGAHTAQVANSAEVKRLVLTHFSQRYQSVQETLDEAKAIFPNTDAAFDLMRIKV